MKIAGFQEPKGSGAAHLSKRAL